MFVIVVTVKMTVFKHEDLLIDLREANRGKLYKGNQLMFIGDGYKAITMMMRNCKDYAPVREKFQAQLNTREKCKLTMKKQGWLMKKAQRLHMSVVARKRRKNIKQIVLERTLNFYAKMRRLRKKLKNEKKA